MLSPSAAHLTTVDLLRTRVWKSADLRQPQKCCSSMIRRLQRGGGSISPLSNDVQIKLIPSASFIFVPHSSETLVMMPEGNRSSGAALGEKNSESHCSNVQNLVFMRKKASSGIEQACTSSWSTVLNTQGYR